MGTVLRIDAAVNRERDCLSGSTVADERPEHADNILRVAGYQIGPENGEPPAALAHYCGMRWALDVRDLRWLTLDLPPLETRQLRRDYAEQYRRYRELFELEVACARREKAAGMASARDWSGIESCFRDAAAVWRFRVMLRLAGLMFRFGVPGALDVCDSAVFGVFRLLYLRPAA